jgi:molybdopterin-guanine dinucleotide biosynthesis protein A
MTATLAVLAGGKGRRMGGPKDGLLIDGRPVLCALLERLAWPGPTLLITPHDGRLPRGYEGFDRAVADSCAGQGPLRGLMTALTCADTDDLVVIPVDMPSLESRHLEWIAARFADQPAAAGIMLKRSTGSGEQIEPFPCALRRSSAPMLRERLAAGQLAVHELAHSPGIETMPAPREWGDDLWRNINTPEDLPPGWTRITP